MDVNKNRVGGPEIDKRGTNNYSKEVTIEHEASFVVDPYIFGYGSGDEGNIEDVESIEERVVGDEVIGDVGEEAERDYFDSEGVDTDDSHSDDEDYDQVEGASGNYHPQHFRSSLRDYNGKGIRQLPPANLLHS